jgi:hypothetical protein
MVYRSKRRVALAIALLIALSSLHSVASLATRTSTPPPVKGMKRLLNAFSSPHRQHEADVLVSASTQIEDGASEKSSRSKTSPVASVLLIFYARSLDLFERQPFLTNSIVTGILAGFGDVLAQSFSGNADVAGVVPAFNWIRWKTFMLTGLLFEGPWLCVWYDGLTKFARWLETKYQWGPRQQVLAKVACDQTIGVAIFYPAFFASYEIFGAVLTGRGTNCTKHTCMHLMLHYRYVHSTGNFFTNQHYHFSFLHAPHSPESLQGLVGMSSRSGCCLDNPIQSLAFR